MTEFESTLKNAERSEEVQHIIERMPSSFGMKITIFVSIIVVVFFSLGWIIKYPDVVTGSIVINASKAPIKLVSNASGKLKLNGYKDYQNVAEGGYVAFIQNSANFEDVRRVTSIIEKIKINQITDLASSQEIPKDVSLGELNVKYFSFLDALTKYTEHKKANVFVKQEQILSKLIDSYKHMLEISSKRLKMNAENLKLIGKFHDRDSILLSKKVVSQAEHDKSNISLISAQDTYQSMFKDIATTTNLLQEAENKVQQNSLSKQEKEKQLELQLVMAFTELEDNIKVWEQKYVFKAPMSGSVQFLKFWTDNQFVQLGEPVFSIVPSKNNIIGQMSLPSNGSGKVSVGQEVIIRLEDYPYLEYGTIKGVVSSISLITNPVSTTEGDVETYLVNVELPNKLKTNYGSSLNFKFQSKGSADIITNERRLIQRLFDNLKYKLKQ